MHCLKMSVTKTILVLSIILYTAGQASSLKCYTCTSTIGEDCYKNPKKTEFEVTCPETRNSDLKFSNIVDFSLLSALVDDSGIRDGAVSYASTTHDCCTVKGTILGIEGVIRSCQLKTLSDEEIKKAATDAGMTVKSFERCDNDLCNSSDSPPTPGSTSSDSPSTPSSTSPVTSTTQAPSTSKNPSTGSSSTPSPGSSSPPSTGSSSTPSPGSTSPPSPGSSSTPSPAPSSTNAPNSSRALSTAILSLTSSLFLVYFIKL